MKKVLFIDDDAYTREVGRKMLEKNGYSVVVASDGKEGLSVIEENNPAVIVTDLFMPTVDGIEVIKQVTRKHPEIPVVALTKFGEAAYLKVARYLGARDGLCKPFGEQELVHAVHSSINTNGRAADRLNH